MQRYYDIAGQQLRAKEIINLLVEFHLADFDKEGIYHGPPGVSGMRERLWFARAFLASESQEARKLANRIIVTTPFRSCHFAPMTAIQILCSYKELLTVQAYTKLYTYLEDSMMTSGNADMDFVGVNDNFPCMSTFITLIGGRLLNLPAFEAVGVKRLYQLKSLLTRRGFATEFNSPTYTGVQLRALAEISNYLEEGELKQISLACEERIWMDQLSHLHLPTSQVAGPYSRAYTVDSVGHTHHSRFALYALFGDKMPIHLRNTLFTSKEGEYGESIHHSAAFMHVSAADVLNTTYHCPEEHVHHALNKTYPYQVIGTTEFSSSTDAPASGLPHGNPLLERDMVEYPAGVGLITTYMQEDYALGTSTHEFHNGVQTDSFHLMYRRVSEAKAQQDTRAVYARYVLNDHVPGQTNTYARLSSTSADSLLWDEGRKLAIQDKGTVMVLYKPKVMGRLQVSSMRLSIILPCQYGDPEEVWLGETRLTDLCGASVLPVPVFIKDGPVYMAFHPLLLTNHGRQHAVRIEKVNGYLLLSFMNYEGDCRDFEPEAFVLTGNGFVAQIVSESEVGSFEAFKEEAAQALIRDEASAHAHSRQTTLRRTSFEGRGVKLACEYSPASEGIKYVEIGGVIPENPRLFITGLDVSRLPFL
ncbi:hypothetical protein [Paenibacillus qinlingensis]|uniref:Uncharacterized protein n=1 Tax=Paenibacillus qinlingensis TaxID=1837343 RepID=A0ABU1NVI4_9BACL|nr:hypothetical protein [Paenibacillus qinlingensis]MDR6550867.1 hypothetical protein [Paenibacillus qinlingensis]